MVPLNIKLNNAAVTLSDQGSYDKAIPYLNNALLATSNLRTRQDCTIGKISEGAQVPFEVKGEYDEGMRAFSDPLSIPTKNLPHNGQCVQATIFFNLGILHTRQQDDEEAFVYFSKILSLKTDDDTEDSDTTSIPNNSFQGPSRIATLHNLGHIYYRARRYADAFAKYAEGLKLARQIHDCHHLDIAASLNCNCVVRLHMVEEREEYIKEALSLITEALMIREAVTCPGGNRDTATVLNNLGRVLVVQGELQNAISIYRKVLNMRKLLLGDDHLDVAATIFNIGETLHAQGNIDEALKMYLTFLSVASKLLSTSHCDIYGALMIIAQVYTRKKDYALASEYYDKALQSVKKAEPLNQPAAATVLNTLGNLHYEHGNLRAALSCYKEGLGIERTYYGDNHMNSLVTILNIARIYQCEKKFHRALEMYTQGLTIQRLLGGDDRYNLACTLSNIGFINHQLRRFIPAIDAHQEALRIKRDLLGPRHFDVSVSLNSLGLAYFNGGLTDDALACFKKSLMIRREINNASSRDIATVLYNIATIYMETDNLPKSLQFYYECLIFERACDGENNDSIITVLKHIGHLHQELNDPSSALKYYKEAVDLCLADCMNKSKQAQIASIFDCMGKIYLNKGDTESAIKTFSRAIRANQLGGRTDYADLTVSEDILSALARQYPQHAATS